MAEEGRQRIDLPKQVLAEAAEAAARQGTSLDDFMTAAVRDRIAKAKAEEFFAERRARVDWEAFDRIMNRPTGAPTVPGDELPEGYVRRPFGPPGG